MFLDLYRKKSGIFCALICILSVGLKIPLSAAGVPVETPVEEQQLKLKCVLIPHRQESICFARTQTFYGPFDDVIFYRMDRDRRLTLIGVELGGVATFGGITFSENGRYLLEEWAEEGHLLIYFYASDDYLDGRQIADTKGTISVYGLEGIEKFTDDGLVSYRVWADHEGKCPGGTRIANDGSAACVGILSLVP